MKLTLPKIRLAAITLSVIVASFGAGYWFGQRDVELKRQGLRPLVKIEREIPPERSDVSFGLFWETWDRLGANYFDKSKLDPQKMVYGAIKGMVAAIDDPYTVFLPPAEQKRTQEDLGGEFEGVGIQIGFKGSRLAVIAPLEGTPAQKAGVRGGDFIVGIKDERKEIDMGTVGITLPEAVEAIRGPAGTPVTLVVTREGVDKPIEIEIVRGRIEVLSVELSFVGEGEQVAHLKLLRFGEQTNGEWVDAIVQIKNRNAKGLILDLRNNPGGFLQGAVFIVSEFVSSGIAVMQEDGSGRRQQVSVSGRATLPNIPLIVLVNGGSASASEIVAGALQDHSRATVVGEKTFGKGTIQEAQELDSSGLHITTARWLTPKGAWVDDTEGLIPNVEVEDDPETEVDEQLQKAIGLFASK